MGKPLYFLNYENLCLTETKQLKLLVPFFAKFFTDPKLSIYANDGADNLSKKCCYPPEVFEEKYKAKFLEGFHPVLAKGVTKKLKKAFSIDIWGLGIITYEILMQKPFWNTKKYLNMQGFFSEYLNEKWLKAMMKENTDKMTIVPMMLQNLVREMVTFDPKRRLSVFSVVRILQKYMEKNLQPGVLDFMGLQRMMFSNIHFVSGGDSGKVVFLPKNYMLSIDSGFKSNTALNGFGTVYFGSKDNRLLHGVLKNGIFVGNVNFQPAVDENVKILIDETRGTPTMANVAYTHRKKRKLNIELKDFMPGTWMLGKDEILGLWNTFDSEANASQSSLGEFDDQNTPHHWESYKEILDQIDSTGKEISDLEERLEKKNTERKGFMGVFVSNSKKLESQ